MKYLIRDGQIWNPSVALYWRAYYGANPHDKHGHVSILTAFEDDVSDWFGADGGGELMPSEADRIIATIGQYEQDSRRLLIELLERQGREIRRKQQRTTERIIAAIREGRGPEEVAKAALVDDGPSVEEVAAGYLAEIEELGKALDDELDAADGRGELVTRADVDAAVSRFRAGLAALAGG